MQLCYQIVQKRPIGFTKLFIACIISANRLIFYHVLFSPQKIQIIYFSKGIKSIEFFVRGDIYVKVKPFLDIQKPKVRKVPWCITRHQNGRYAFRVIYTERLQCHITVPLTSECHQTVIVIPTDHSIGFFLILDGFVILPAIGFILIVGLEKRFFCIPIQSSPSHLFVCGVVLRECFWDRPECGHCHFVFPIPKTTDSITDIVLGFHSKILQSFVNKVKDIFCCSLYCVIVIAPIRHIYSWFTYTP